MKSPGEPLAELKAPQKEARERRFTHSLLWRGAWVGWGLSGFKGRAWYFSEYLKSRNVEK